VLLVRTSRRQGLHRDESEHSAADDDRAQGFVPVAIELIAAVSIGAAGLFISTECGALPWLMFIEWLGNR